MFRILTLSGGGYLGLFSAAVLSEFEKRRGAPIYECFDLIAGTSVGGLIALGLAVGKSATEIASAIESLGQTVFPTHKALRFRLPKYASAPLDASRFLRNLQYCRYGDASLRQSVESMLGTDAVLKDCIRPVIIPTVCLTLGKPRIFKSGGGTERLVDVALATTAAPTFFPTADINGAQYADGGLFANCPDLVALHEAEVNFARHRNDLYVLSVGTTEQLVGVTAGTRRDLGIVGWMRDKRLINTVMASQQELVKQVMKAALGPRYSV